MPHPRGLDNKYVQFLPRCAPYTQLDWQRLSNLYSSVKYIVENDIPGDLVECGVWKGGACMMMALTLLSCGDRSRKIYLYDTYAGMSKPIKDIDITFEDVDYSHGEQSGIDEWKKNQRESYNEWCYGSIEEVRRNVLSTGIDEGRLVFVRGKVEESIPGNVPARISLLRLDTDWYESTLHELIHLYPLLSTYGVLISDDYGFWQGAKKAFDEYFAQIRMHPLLIRDTVGVTTIKIPDK